MADATARSVALEGFSLTIVVIVLVCLAFAVLSVGIRTYVRLTDKFFGLDDGLIVAALIAYIADIGLAVRAVEVGVGSKNDRLNAWMQSEAQKYYIIWITIYVVGVALIKSSVCVTLMRIAVKSHRAMRIAVWSLLGLTWASFCVTFFGILTYCRPIEGNWNTALVAEGKAKCADADTLIGISHTNTATSIATDIGCIVLPGMLLWKTRMKTKAKLQVFGLLSVASIASITTIARAPFISRYHHPTDNLMFYIGFIVLLSCVETGIGCTAASLPSMRRFYLRLRGIEDTTASSSAPHSKSIVTIGGGVVGRSGSRGPKAAFSNPTDRGVTTTHIGTGTGDWERLNDEDSDKGILLNGGSEGIRTHHTYAVELEPVKTARSGSAC